MEAVAAVEAETEGEGEAGEGRRGGTWWLEEQAENVALRARCAVHQLVRGQSYCDAVR